MARQDNLSRGNQGALDALKRHVPAANTHLRFVVADLGVKEQARSADMITANSAL